MVKFILSLKLCILAHSHPSFLSVSIVLSLCFIVMYRVTEDRAQQAEERASHAEAELSAASERIRQLERQLDGSPGAVEEIISVTAKPKSAASQKSQPEKATQGANKESKEKEKKVSATSAKPHTASSRASSKTSTKGKKSK